MVHGMPESRGELTIRTGGDTDELFRLLEWLNGNDELRGRISMPTPAIQPGQMGGLAEVLVVALGAGGVATALTQSLTAWLTHRRSDVALTLTYDRTELTVDAKRVKPAEIAKALDALLDQANKSQ